MAHEPAMDEAQRGRRHARAMPAKPATKRESRRRRERAAGATARRAGSTAARARPRERVTAIEFRWVAATGIQPVVLVSREWLH
jgi:hypothetical protein